MEEILANDLWITYGGYTLLCLGIALLVAEFAVPSFGLLGFAGAATFIIGIVQLYQTGAIETLPFNVAGLYAIAALGILLSIAGGLYGYWLYRKKNTTGIEAMTGQEARVLEWKGRKGRVHISGEEWRAQLAQADSPAPKKDDRVIIKEVKNLTLIIEKV